MIKRISWAVLIVAALGLALALGAYFGMETWLFVTLTCAFAVFAAAFAGLAARRIVKPLRDFDPERKTGRGYKEIAPIMDRLTRQSQLIDLQMADLKRSQEEFRAITDSMAEGFALVDTDMKLVSYNPSARKLMGDGGVESSGLFRDAAQQALDGRHTERTAELDGHVYQILANPVEDAGRVTGAVIITLDITEKAHREAMRHDFSSNVSHELRTPLTSIYGISELMMNGMVKPEDVADFARNIHDESGRLIALINDIIKLTQLDDGVYELERAEIDLAAVAKSVVARLKPVGALRGIEFAVTGSSATVHGIPSVIDEMVYNLADNAMKYNVENGRVLISTATLAGRPVITVSDTGIGIPREHIDRVFERFYRVDKSHSKKIGGTGLGLSIVKHGAAVHGANVDLKSRPGRGTVVTITFPAAGENATPSPEDTEKTEE